MKRKNKVLLFILIVFLTIISTPISGNIYNKYLGPVTNWFWGSAHPEYLGGFTFSFLFFGSLLSRVFFIEKKLKYWLYYTLPFLIFMLLLGAYEELIVGVSLVLIGWLLAQGILLVYKKFKET